MGRSRNERATERLWKDYISPYFPGWQESYAPAWGDQIETGKTRRDWKTSSNFDCFPTYIQIHWQRVEPYGPRRHKGKLLGSQAKS